MLLAEMGSDLVTNKNWKEEAIAILWTVQNRVSWMEQVALGTEGYESTFSGCDRGYVSCATAGKQYATTTTSRGRDPLYLDPPEPAKADSYYADQVSQAVANAALAASLFVDGSTVDPTGGATYFSHADPECSTTGNTCFAKQVDTPTGSYHKTTLVIPYIPR